MSFYSLVFTVPKNTAEEAPYEQKLPVTGGILHQVSVVIPPGHAGLTGCALDQGLHQIAPTNQNEWFRGDDVRFSYDEYVELPPDTRELVLRGFNLDTLYDHGFVIAVGILPAEIYNAILGLREDLAPMISNMASLAAFFGHPNIPSGG
jgi:hypothetical protein